MGSDGRTGEIRTRIPSVGLIGFKPRASADCATVRCWCEAPESNRDAPSFEFGRYAYSRQLRMRGAFPGIRTRNIWFLKPARLPVAPERRGLVPISGFEPGSPCFYAKAVGLFLSDRRNGAQSGIRTRRIMPLKHARMPIPSSGRGWCRQPESNGRPAVLLTRPLLYHLSQAGRGICWRHRRDSNP